MAYLGEQEKLALNSAKQDWVLSAHFTSDPKDSLQFHSKYEKTFVFITKLSMSMVCYLIFFQTS